MRLLIQSSLRWQNGAYRAFAKYTVMTLCCQCRWEWPSFPCDYQSQYISHSLTFNGQHNVTCMIRGMGSITTLSQQKLITQAVFLFYFALILFLLLKFATHSILFIGPPSIGTLFLYRRCWASCFILTQWNYVPLNLL